MRKNFMKDQIKSVIYKKEMTKNKQKKPAGANWYYRAFLVDENGNEQPVMFTQSDVAKARLRADRNPEDQGVRHQPWWKFW